MTRLATSSGAAIGHHRFWFGCDDIGLNSIAAPSAFFRGRLSPGPTPGRGGVDLFPSPAMLALDSQGRAKTASPPQKLGPSGSRLSWRPAVLVGSRRLASRPRLSKIFYFMLRRSSSARCRAKRRTSSPSSWPLWLRDPHRDASFHFFKISRFLYPCIWSGCPCSLSLLGSVRPNCSATHLPPLRHARWTNKVHSLKQTFAPLTFSIRFREHVFDRPPLFVQGYESAGVGCSSNK